MGAIRVIDRIAELADYPAYDASVDSRDAVVQSAASADATSKANSAQSNAIASAAASLSTHTGNTSNPHSVTKSQVGLGSVPNTDTTNPANISQDSTHRFATDTEKSTWNGKQDALGFTPVPNTRTVNGHALSADVTVTKGDVGLGNCDNTSDANKPVSTAQAAADTAVANAAASDATTKANQAKADALAADPVKASAAEVVTGTNDTKFATPKAIKDAGIVPPVANITIPMILSSVQVNLNEGTGAKQALYTCPATFNGVSVGGCIITNIVMQKFSTTAAAANFAIGWNAGATDVASMAIADFGGVGATQSLNMATPALGLGANLLAPNPVIGLAADVLGLIVTAPEGSALTARVQAVGYFVDTNGVAIPNVIGIAP